MDNSIGDLSGTTLCFLLLKRIDQLDGREEPDASGFKDEVRHGNDTNGGSLAKDVMERSYSHIDLDERRKIARWRTAGLTVDARAEQLGRHRSTIFREIKRNTFVDKVVPELTGYYCVTAHDMACARRAKLHKLTRFSHVRQSAIERIIHGWSPQQIAGRMRLERHPISVSHETIYKFAYSADGQAIKLWHHLPEHRARRRPRHARRKHGQRFSPELNILHRPDVIADRKQFGHWECDLIQLRKKFGKANVTSLVERVSRFAIFLRNNDRQSRPVMDGLVRALQALPHLARRSITFDRGTEFTDWPYLQASIGTQTWFCDPQGTFYFKVRHADYSCRRTRDALG